MDSSVLLQLQKVVSCSVAALVNIDAGCRSNSKACFILGERRGLMWQYIFLTVSSFLLAVEYNF